MEHGAARIRRKHAALTILCGLSAGLLVASILLAILLSHKQNELDMRAKGLLGLADSSLQQREQIFADVRSFEPVECSEDTLGKLRRNLVDLRNVVDVVVFSATGNNIICSAVGGVFARAYELATVPGTTLRYPHRLTWLSVKLDFLPGEADYHLVREGRFGAVLSPAPLKKAGEDLRWSLLLVGAKKTISQYGTLAAGTTQDGAPTGDFSPLAVHTRVCSFAYGDICIVAERLIPEILASNVYLVVLGSILAAALASLVAIYVSQYLRQRYSVAGRSLRALKDPRSTHFSCVYQPIVDLQTGEIVGCEVLARYKDEFGSIPPNLFVPVIDAAGLTWSFTERVIENVARDMKMLANRPGFRISINFYPADLANRHQQPIKDWGLLRKLQGRGFQVVCEILETGIGESGDIKQTLRFLREFGFKVAIDDFGTGFSNLQQLKDIKPQYLKIDKSFVDEISEETASVKGCLLPHIVTLARETGSEVIAEGIETVHQLFALRTLGVEFGQGYHFSAPVVIAELNALIAINAQQILQDHHAEIRLRAAVA